MLITVFGILSPILYAAGTILILPVYEIGDATSTLLVHIENEESEISPYIQAPLAVFSCNSDLDPDLDLDLSKIAIYESVEILIGGTIAVLACDGDECH